jgi:SAM-dependent methyltransferase
LEVAVRRRVTSHIARLTAATPALVVVFVTASATAFLRWSEDASLFVLGAISFASGTTGYLARRVRWRGWLSHHILGMSLSYIVLLTAFSVDNGPRLPLWDRLPPVAFWGGPSLIGLPLLVRALRRRARPLADLRAAAWAGRRYPHRRGPPRLPTGRQAERPLLRALRAPPGWEEYVGEREGHPAGVPDQRTQLPDVEVGAATTAVRSTAEGQRRMTPPQWAPPEAWADRPNAARMYDYYLGGYHNFEPDREMAKQAIALWPDLPLIMRANRAFLRRAVTYLIGQGIDQFLDIGSGIPTVGNVHQVAKRANPDARVVYVDIDPVAVTQSRAILRGTPGVAAVQADVRAPERILGDPEVRALLDFGRPVAVLLVAVLHFVTDEAVAERSVRLLREALAPGSYLVICHASYEGVPAQREEHEALYARTPTPLKMRSRSKIQRFFAGFDMVEPGLVYIPLWRPERPDDLFVDEPERCTGFAGVGRKPSPREP